jgi:hypothetical protein
LGVTQTDRQTVWSSRLVSLPFLSRNILTLQRVLIEQFWRGKDYELWTKLSVASLARTSDITFVFSLLPLGCAKGMSGVSFSSCPRTEEAFSLALTACSSSFLSFFLSLSRKPRCFLFFFEIALSAE